MPKPPLPISLLTTQSESSDMAESTSIWLQFPFGFGVMKRKRYWRFLVKLRKITIGESSWPESSRLWAVEFREKEKNKEDQGEEVRGCGLCGWMCGGKQRKEKKKEDKRWRVGSCGWGKTKGEGLASTIFPIFFFNLWTTPQ